MADYLKNFAEDEAILASETNSNNQYLLNQISERAAGLQTYLENQVERLKGSFVLTGAIVGLAYDEVPVGYLKCDGASLLREDYKELFDVIGTIYGYEDDYHFNLPDFRGMFLRGTGGNAASLGVNQEAGLPNITGSFKTVNQSGNWGATGAFTGKRGGGAGVEPENNAFHYTDTYSLDASLASAVYGKSNEVTPANYAVNWVIKY